MRRFVDFRFFGLCGFQSRFEGVWSKWRGVFGRFSKMPAYNSTMNDVSADTVCGMAVLPIKSSVKGPCPAGKAGEDDIIDEALRFFRANVLFASFEVKGHADRTLIFLTLFIAQCLKRLEKGGDKKAGAKLMFDLSKEKFSVPGEQGWQLSGFIFNPKNRAEEDKCRAFLKQLREETSSRVVEILYARSEAAPDKFWMGFSKRKFMGLLVK